MPKVTPLDDRVVVTVNRAGGKSKGGIVLPDAAADGEAKRAGLRGQVVAAGPGRLLDNGARAGMQVKVEDRVVFGAYAGTEVQIDGVEHVILREADILGIETE